MTNPLTDPQLAEVAARALWKALDEHNFGAHVGDMDFPRGESTLTCLDGHFDLHEVAQDMINHFEAAAKVRTTQQPDKDTAELVRAQTIEECAKVCDEDAAECGRFSGGETREERFQDYHAEHKLIAAAKKIRALTSNKGK